MSWHTVTLHSTGKGMLLPLVNVENPSLYNSELPMVYATEIVNPNKLNSDDFVIVYVYS